ncbi:MAG: hypothetical protein HOP12_06950 [Candidatus Eisenbacteria bacterium]|uniref:histidine kinase n=1 Tax=Eiseniibacteriota bacterium TaxID=2212470 RepID=A0A849SHF9_UNCEI|nr:hypothetical protein [Candidatus Eisenbacteria bacterium]
MTQPAGSLSGRVVWLLGIAVGLVVILGAIHLHILLVFCLVVFAVAGLMTALREMERRSEQTSKELERLHALREYSLVALFELSHEFDVSMEEHQMGTLTLTSIMGHSGIVGACLWLRRPGDETGLQLVARKGLKEDRLEAFAAELQLLSMDARVLREGIFLDRPESLPARPEFVKRATLAGVRGVMPLMAGGELIGFTGLGRRASNTDFSSFDLEVVRTMLSMLGRAVENGRLYSRQQQHNEELASVNRELQQTNESLREASRLKAEFLANISHELRTPLTGVLGFLDLLRGDTPTSREQQLNFVSRARACGARLLHLINDLLDYAQAEAGRLEMEKRAVPARSVLEDLRRAIEARAAESKLELRVDLAGADALRVWADGARLHQALCHVAENAIKFTPQGSVTIRVRNDLHSGQCTFEVVDTGVGIAPEIRQAVVQPFVQGDGSSTRVHGGTGLGLALTVMLVEQMGGRIAIDTPSEHPGTRVLVSLPLADEAGETAAEAVIEATSIGRIEGPLGAPLVLVVEDREPLRAYLRDFLHSSGYRTVDADTAESGCLVARRLRPSVIVSDYALEAAPRASVRTGYDMARRLGLDEATRSIPILFLTGFSNDLKQQLDSNPEPRRRFHTLDKPVDEDAVLEVLSQWLPNGGEVRTLLIDSVEFTAARIQHALPAERFHFESALTAKQAVSMLRNQPRAFDLILASPGAFDGTEGTDMAKLLQEVAPPEVFFMLLGDSAVGSTDSPWPAEESRLIGCVLRDDEDFARQLESLLDVARAQRGANEAEPNAESEAA